MKMYKVVYHLKDGSHSDEKSIDHQMFPHEIAEHLKNQLSNDSVRLGIANDRFVPVSDIKSIEILL